jgi:hypothetical protein
LNCAECFLNHAECSLNWAYHHCHHLTNMQRVL